MNEYRTGENRSWISIKNYIPGRIQYFYWDDEINTGKNFFNVLKLNIKYKRKYFAHPKKLFKGMIITGWKKDREKIEEILNAINYTLKEKYTNEYENFLEEWYKSFQEEMKNETRD